MTEDHRDPDPLPAGGPNPDPHAPPGTRAGPGTAGTAGGAEDAADSGVPGSEPRLVGRLVGVPVWVCPDRETDLACADALGELLVLGDLDQRGPWRPAAVFPAAVTSVFLRGYAAALGAAPAAAPLQAAADVAGVAPDLLLVLADVADEVVEATCPVDFTGWPAAQWVEFDRRARSSVTGAACRPAEDPAARGWAGEAGAVEEWAAAALGELVVLSVPYLLTRLPEFSRPASRQLLATVADLVSRYPLLAAVTTTPVGYRSDVSLRP